MIDREARIGHWYTLRPGDGAALSLGSAILTLKTNTQPISASYAVIEYDVQPPAAESDHTELHAMHAQALYLKDGDLTLRLDSETVDLTSGDCVLLPRGRRFCWWNSGKSIARVLEITAPGGFEGFEPMLAGTIPGLELRLPPTESPPGPIVRSSRRNQ